MAVEAFGKYPSEYILLYEIAKRIDPMIAPIGTFTGNRELLYEILVLLDGGTGTGGLWHIGDVTADGTAVTAIPDLALKTINTDCRIFHSGTLRDASLEITSLDGSGNLTWVSGFEPAAGTKIYYEFF